MEASAGIVRKIGNRAAIVGRSRKPEGRQRSKISNGNKVIAGVDGRSLWVRRRCSAICLAAMPLSVKAGLVPSPPEGNEAD